MARIDEIKEEIGWLKLLFGVLVAVDLPLVGWLAQNYGTASGALVLVGVLAAIAMGVGLVRVNRLAYRRIRELREVEKP